MSDHPNPHLRGERDNGSAAKYADDPFAPEPDPEEKTDPKAEEDFPPPGGRRLGLDEEDFEPETPPEERRDPEAEVDYPPPGR